MNIKKTDKVIQAALTLDEYQKFRAIGVKKDWSDKKLTEKIVRTFINAVEKDPDMMDLL